MEKPAPEAYTEELKYRKTILRAPDLPSWSLWDWGHGRHGPESGYGGQILAFFPSWPPSRVFLIYKNIYNSLSRMVLGHGFSSSPLDSVLG